MGGGGEAELFVPVDMHHYDEEDYRDHRERAYPHVHQPLRSMEPRVLREIKSRIKAGRRRQQERQAATVSPTTILSNAAESAATESAVSIVEAAAGGQEGSKKGGKRQQRRRLRRRQRRARKQEPFQPTLCKLSEESSSPLHCCHSYSSVVDTIAAAAVDGALDRDRGGGSEVQEELSGSVSHSDSRESSVSFLEEISSNSMELPVGFLDILTLHNNTYNNYHGYTTRQNSLPFFDNIDNVDIIGNINSSQSFSDLKKPIILSPSNIQPLPIINIGEDDSAAHDHRDESLYCLTACSSDTHMVISPITHPQGDSNHTNLTQVASTSAITSDSSIKISNCNFQIGSVDSISLSQQNIFNVDLPASTHRSISEPVDYSKKETRPIIPHHHHHHHHKEHYNKKDLEKRTFSGQDMRTLWQSKDSEQVDEYESTLGDAIIDDMRNHRCYEMPALNRSRIHNRYNHSNATKEVLHRSRSVTHPRTDEKYQRNQEKIKKCTTCEDDVYKMSEYTKSQQDLIFQSNMCAVEWNSIEAMQENPLPLFVEMDILKPHKYWREISRWIRYEQSYNELSDTFGRAHSSPLKFTAFTQFRIQLEDAIFMPNVEVKTFEEAINQLTEELIVAQLFAEPRDAVFVKEVFKWKHVHAGEKFTSEGDENSHPPCESILNLFPSEKNEFNLRMINTSPGNINNSTSPTPICPAVTKISFDYVTSKSTDPNLNNKFGQHSNFPSMIKMLKNSIPILRHPRYPKSDLEGHLPVNTEGVTVQVGALESLKKPFLAILRFKSPILMDRVTELNLPIRFLIVCLGPPAKIQYEELGRVISSMLINKDFCKLMYRATDKCEIIEGLYKYLDSCFVLSYAGPKPTKNMHTMVDHINDFVRVPTYQSPFHSVAKEPEGIKHSASLSKPYGQRSESVRFDSTHRGDNPFDKIIYEQPESDLESGKDVDLDNKDDEVHVNFRPQQSKDDEKVNKTYFKKRQPIQYQMCCNISFFLFRLLRLDVVKYKNRFLSDFKDAFMKDNIAVVLCGLIYLYFVCLSPALTFGVLLGDLVSNEFNVQMVLACNGLLTIFFALVGGNPILVIGITGPMFLMETVIAKMALSFNLPIMLYRFVIAIYVSLIGLVSVALNITWVMQKVRRSVEECFNGFVGLYFIFKAVLTIVRIFDVPYTNLSKNHTVMTSEVDGGRIAIGFASLVLAYSMYQICMALNSVNRGRFFTRKFRKMVDYFNVAIGIVVLSLMNVVIINMLGINLPTLKTETSNSTWVRIPPIAQTFSSVSFTAHMIALSLAFALMSLIFTETAISGITVTKAEKKLVKSSLFAQDQFMCLFVIPLICGVLGWPFLSGAAVRSTSHVMAMTKLDQKVIPGVKHKILGVVEQRVTMLVVGGLILATVSIESILRYVPTSAMLGMFLYMGVKGIRDLVVTRRLVAMFKRPKHWKDHEYLRDIPPSVLKSFEILQLTMIVIMFSMNCITEFTGISWPSFLIPVILLAYAICRETVLPWFRVFALHLDKMDPRHTVQMSSICVSEGSELSSDKHRTFNTQHTSETSCLQGSSTLGYTGDSKFDFDDGTNTSGDEVSSSSTSGLGP